MALPFPNVPNLPGVPPIPRLPGAVVSTALTVGSGVITALLGGAAQKPNLWGIYNAKGTFTVTPGVGAQSTGLTPVLNPDSTLEFSYRRDFDVSDFPVVNGAFASYNKVQRPFEVQLRLSKGSTQQARTQFLNAIETLASSLTLYDIHTPEKIYQNCNLARWEVSRTSAKDAFFLTQVDLTFVEIRQTTAQYGTSPIFLPGISPYSSPSFDWSLQNAQSPAALPTVNQGTVQPQPTSGNAASIGQNALNTAATNPKTY